MSKVDTQGRGLIQLKETCQKLILKSFLRKEKLSKTVSFSCSIIMIIRLQIKLIGFLLALPNILHYRTLSCAVEEQHSFLVTIYIYHHSQVILKRISRTITRGAGFHVMKNQAVMIKGQPFYPTTTPQRHSSTIML